MQPHRKKFYENRKQISAFIPPPFFSLTLSLGAAVNTLGKEAQATAAFSKPDHTWAQAAGIIRSCRRKISSLERSIAVKSASNR